MHITEKYRVFELVFEDPPKNMSEAIVKANEAIAPIEGASMEWSFDKINVRFEGSVSAHNILLDIIDELAALGYK